MSNDLPVVAGVTEARSRPASHIIHPILYHGVFQSFLHLFALFLGKIQLFLDINKHLYSRRSHQLQVSGRCYFCGKVFLTLHFAFHEVHYFFIRPALNRNKLGLVSTEPDPVQVSDFQSGILPLKEVCVYGQLPAKGFFVYPVSGLDIRQADLTFLFPYTVDVGAKYSSSDTVYSLASASYPAFMRSRK